MGHKERNKLAREQRARSRRAQLRALNKAVAFYTLYCFNLTQECEKLQKENLSLKHKPWWSKWIG